MKRFFTRYVAVAAMFTLGLLFATDAHAQANLTEWITSQDVLVDGPVAVGRLIQAADVASAGGMEDDANNSGIDGLPLFYRTVAAEIRDNSLTAREAINKTAAQFLRNGVTPQTVGALVASTKMILS
jgi:hypothetical protein